MNLILRLIFIIVRARYRPRLQPFDISVVHMRVLPNDLDLQLHMNNGRFLSIMDLGRVDLMIRTGFWRKARQRRWFPVVGSTLIDYRRSLTVFQSYELRTKILGWDDRWIYVEQQFVSGSVVAARATLKTMMRSSEGAVLPSEALSVMELSETSPALPDYVEVMARTDRGKELLA